MEKLCSRCNKPFGCKSEMPGCWCEQVELNSDTLHHLKMNYDNCLCPACLENFKAGQELEVLQLKRTR